MRLIRPVPLALVFVIAAIMATPGPVMGAPTRLSVPAAVQRLYQQALATSPRALALERDLELAESRQRAALGAFETSTGVRFNAFGRYEGSHRGVGSAVQWGLRHPMGRSEIRFAVGPGIAQREGRSELEAAPVLSLEVRHPLGQGPDVRRERAQQELARAELRYEQGLAAFQRDLVQAYGRLEGAKKALEAAETRLHVEGMKLEALTARAQHGDAAALALFEARRRHGEALDAWEAARLAVEEAALALALLVGADGDADTDTRASTAEETIVWEFVAEGLPAGVSSVPLEQWVEWARTGRRERALAETEVALAEAELESVRRQRGWAGDFSVRANYPDPDSFPGSAARKGTWRVALQLDMPLKEPVSEEAVVQAELRLEEAQTELAFIEQQLEAEVVTAFHQVERAQRRMERALRQKEQAQWLLDVAAEKVAAGVETEEGLWEARAAMAQAEAAHVEAYYDYIVQVMALWHATGRNMVW